MEPNPRPSTVKVFAVRWLHQSGKYRTKVRYTREKAVELKEFIEANVEDSYPTLYVSDVSWKSEDEETAEKIKGSAPAREHWDKIIQVLMLSPEEWIATDTLFERYKDLGGTKSISDVRRYLWRMQSSVYEPYNQISWTYEKKNGQRGRKKLWSLPPQE